MSGIIWVLRWRRMVVWQLLTQRPGSILGQGLLFGFVIWIVMVAVADATRSGFWVPVALSMAAGIVIAAWLLSGQVARVARRRAAAHGEITTERFVLRRPRSADADAYAASVDADMMTANGWTAALRVRAISRMRQCDRLPLEDVLVIADRSTAEPLGWISISNADLATGICELGWSMAPHARNKGYSTEAIGAALDALHRAGYRQVSIGTAEGNVPVRRVLDKTGATLTRTGPHTLPDGSSIPSVWYVHEAGTPDA
jgi:RimJ/RimL family protein N-acetyltransferase